MPTRPANHNRWSDEQLQEFYDAFMAHMLGEENEKQQQNLIYEALFRKEDPESNTPPGVIQLLAQMSGRLQAIEKANAQQKTFFGGVFFAITCVGFFLSDTFHKLAVILKSL